MNKYEETLKRIDQFNKDRDWDQFHSLENLAKSISIESGELLEHFQWNNECDIEGVKEELADVVNYCMQMAIALDVDLMDIVNEKIDKNAIKYPVNKAKGKSDKYNKL